MEKVFAEKSNFPYEIAKDYQKLCKKIFTAIKIKLTEPLTVTSHFKKVFSSNGDRHFVSPNGGKKINKFLAIHMHNQCKSDSDSLISLQRVFFWIRRKIMPLC